MAETDPAGTTDPSAEAQARQTIDAQKTEIATLKQQAVQVGQERYVERYVRSKGITDDTSVDQWIDTMMPTAGQINFEDQTQYLAALDTKFGTLIQPPVVPPTEQQTPPAENVVPPAPGAPAPSPAETAPGFTQPNPGAPGQPPAGQQPYEYGDPYIQELVQTGNRAELDRLDKAKMIRWTGKSERYDRPGVAGT